MPRFRHLEKLTTSKTINTKTNVSMSNTSNQQKEDVAPAESNEVDVNIVTNLASHGPTCSSQRVSVRDKSGSTRDDDAKRKEYMQGYKPQKRLSSENVALKGSELAGHDYKGIIDKQPYTIDCFALGGRSISTHLMTRSWMKDQFMLAQIPGSGGTMIVFGVQQNDRTGEPAPHQYRADLKADTVKGSVPVLDLSCSIPQLEGTTMSCDREPDSLPKICHEESATSTNAVVKDGSRPDRQTDLSDDRPDLDLVDNSSPISVALYPVPQALPLEASTRDDEDLVDGFPKMYDTISSSILVNSHINYEKYRRREWLPLPQPQYDGEHEERRAAEKRIDVEQRLLRNIASDCNTIEDSNLKFPLDLRMGFKCHHRSCGRCFDNLELLMKHKDFTLH